MNMTRSMWMCLILCVVFGLLLGALWSPRSSSHASDAEQSLGQDPSSSDEEYYEKAMSVIRKEFGEEAEEFARQFKGMDIQFTKFPVRVKASKDGTFVIRLMKEEHPIVSNLRQRDIDGSEELVRYYFFPCGNSEYTCSFSKRVRDSKITLIHYSVDENNGPKYSYADRDGDGLWDQFTDYTHEPEIHYEREGLCWRKRTKDINGAHTPYQQ